TTQDVTTSSTWITSDAATATVSAGLVTGLAAGDVNISCTNSGVSSNLFLVTILTVPLPPLITLVSILISGVSNSLLVGNSVDFSAQAVYSDNSTNNINK